MNREILEHKSLQEQVEILLNEVERLEKSDSLTSLASRRGLYEYYIAMERDKNVHVMFIEINNFKKINDVYGYHMGDELLTHTGELIKSCVEGFAARTEGNEFVVIMDAGMSEEEVVKCADKLMAGMHDMDVRKDILSHVSLSIGVVLHHSVTELFS